jgi:hypothetical protein
LDDPNNAESERRTLDGVFAALGLRPDDEPEQGETPDFLLRAGGRLIGVEITMYRSGATVEDGTERRPVESEWERLKVAADVFRTRSRGKSARTLTSDDRRNIIVANSAQFGNEHMSADLISCASGIARGRRTNARRRRKRCPF